MTPKPCKTAHSKSKSVLIETTEHRAQVAIFALTQAKKRAEDRRERQVADAINLVVIDLHAALRKLKR